MARKRKKKKATKRPVSKIPLFQEIAFVREAIKDAEGKRQWDMVKGLSARLKVLSQDAIVVRRVRRKIKAEGLVLRKLRESSGMTHTSIVQGGAPGLGKRK